MPLGTLHIITGILHIVEHRIFVAVNDGGEWELEISAGLSRYKECAVVIEGLRTGFNRLEVVRIKHEGQEWNPQKSWTKWFEKWRKGKDEPDAEG